MSRRERLERKLELRREWADKRRANAAARFETAHKATEHIPFGQPILVGHHSEKRHRAAIARSDSNMRAGVESAHMAERHDSKARGLESQLDNSIFSDDPDAIEQIEAKIARLETERERNNAFNKIVRAKPKNECTAEKLAQLAALGISEPAARKLFEPDYGGCVGIPSYVNQNLGGNITRLRQRVESIKRRQQRASEAEAAPGGVLVKRFGEWASVTFAEKPDRAIINELKAAGFHWGAGSWSGKADKLPASVTD